MLKSFSSTSNMIRKNIKYNILKLLIYILLLSLLGCGEVKHNSESLKKQKPNNIVEENGMVLIRGATYLRGNDKRAGNGDYYPEESPSHKVTVSSFWIDKYEVTNSQFKEFVDATGYVTFAEKALDKKFFTDAPAEQLKPGATVFSPPQEKINPKEKNDPWDWWSYKVGACWKRPEGGNSSIASRMDHPVVCINIDDAKAFAKWKGKRLPTEAEWELAARGGLKQKQFVWGDKANPNDQWLANCFQGIFPNANSASDGYLYTSPVGSFPPNGYGIYDMAGNVWEMCSDFFHPSFYREFVKNPHPDPTGPKHPISQIELDHFHRTGTCPTARSKMNKLMFLHVSKGGSFLCHWDYCLRYRPAARNHTESLSPSNHTGFRCARDVDANSTTSKLIIKD